MSKLPLEPLDCKGCYECCKWLTFIVALSPETFTEHIDFYTRRGAKIQILTGSVAITVPSPCPHLIGGSCSIHKDKPYLCKKYDCRKDPFLKGGKYYGGEEKSSGNKGFATE